MNIWKAQILKIDKMYLRNKYEIHNINVINNNRLMLVHVSFYQSNNVNRYNFSF